MPSPADALQGSTPQPPGTHGTRSYTGFVPATGAAVAVVTSSPKAPDPLARRLLARSD